MNYFYDFTFNIIVSNYKFEIFIYSYINMSELEKLRKEKYKEESKGNWKDVAVICNYMGQLLSKAGNCEEALEIHEEELQICESQNDLLGVAIANRRICECYSDMGNYKKALYYGKKYLDISVMIGSQLEEQRAWATLGRTFYYMVENGDLSVLEKAENAFTKSLELVEKLRNEVSVKQHAEMKARLLLNVGLIYNKRGNILQCAESIKQAIFLTKKHSLTEDLHRCQYSLANVYEQFGNLTFALRLADEAISSAKILKDKALICDSLLLKVQIMITLKDFHGAKLNCKKAYKIKQNETNDQIRTEKYLKGLHYICNNENQLKLLTDSEISKKTIYLEKIGDALSSLSYYKLAVQYYISTLENLKKMGKHDNELTAIYFSIAQTYADDEQYDKALEYFQKELNGYTGNEEEQCKTLLKIADILEEQQNYKQLKIICEKALILAENCQQSKLQYQCLQQMKCLQEKFKNLFDMKEVERKLDNIVFDDTVMKEREEIDMCEDTPEYFNEVSLSDISDCTDNEIEDEIVNFPKRSRKKLDSKRNDVGETPLHRACIEGNLKFVKRLIENGHIVNPRDNCGWIPLHEASNYGYYDIVEYLIEKGAWINDNGGELCEGITPLHDAANCGHIDVMRLLIEKGASVKSKNSDGDTPLDCLKKWRERTHCDLDSRELEEILNFEKELSDKLKQNQELNSDEELSVSNFDVYSNEGKNIDKRQHSPSVSPSPNFQNSDLNISYDEFHNTYLKDDILENNMDLPNVACFEYQSVMSNLRKSGLSTKQNAKIHVSDKNISAVIDEDKIVNDWLLDDLQERKHLSKRMRTNNSDRGIYSKSKEKSKLKQLKLSNIISVSDTNDVEFEEMPDNDSNIEYCKEVSSVQNVIENSSKSFSKSTFCVKVKIEDKLILIPVNDLELTINWLECEASRRYYNLVGKKPQLQLNTSDGAVLESSDPIGLVVTNCEEILAIVKTWEVPQITERYKEYCVTVGLKSQYLLKELQTTEVSGELSIKNVIFNIKIAKAIFYSIHYQENMKILNISGCYMGDEMTTMLANSLITLHNLTFLGLRCCALTKIGIQNIVKICFLDTSENKPLKNLEKLNIAYNPIGPDSLPISNFLKYCTSLTSIDLSGCDIESRTLQDKILLSELKKKTSFQEIYLANNKLSLPGFIELFSNLQVNELKKLDLSCTVNFGEKNIGSIFGKCFSQTLFLLHLSLCGCHLQNDDIAEIEKGLISCSNLQYLDLSANPGLSPVYIEHLLYSLSSSNIPITYLDLCGSINWNCQISEIYFNFSSKLNTVIISINNKLENPLNWMFSTWRKIHGKYAKCIRGPGNMIEFTLDTIF